MSIPCANEKDVDENGSKILMLSEGNAVWSISV